MPLMNSSEEENGKNIALGIIGVRRILQENLELEINAQRRIASIDDPVRRQWTAATLGIRDCVASAFAPQSDRKDEDEMLNAFLSDMSNERMFDAQSSCELIMRIEGREAVTLLERFFSTDSLWLLNKMRNVVDQFYYAHPTTEPTNGLGLIKPEPGLSANSEIEFTEASVTLRDPWLNMGAISFGHIASAPMMPIIFSPEDPPSAPIVAHKLLKEDPGLLGQICNFGISHNCWNRMDKLLAFPLGNAVVYFTSCGNCLHELDDFIQEPEPEPEIDDDDLVIASVEA
jgi:hypothetical protein